MQVRTGWLRPPNAIGGLDHLGTQGPCILIYSQLLPGITNVTDRARYYSFYPWVVWSFEKRYATGDADTFVEYYRRADCLFSLIAERHSRATDGDHERHGAAMVGRLQLVPAIDRLERGEELRLSNHTGADSPRRYFKNRLGGLGQYYAGTLSQLELMDPSSRPWIKYTVERGQPLAEAIEAATPADRFWSVVEADQVSIADLDELSPFCACSIPTCVAEQQALTDIFFDRDGAFGEFGEQRRRSLALVLHLSKCLHQAGGQDLTEAVFRAAVYAGTLPGQTTWDVPPRLSATRDAWSLYERNDLLSVSMQCVLAFALGKLAADSLASGLNTSSVEAFAASLARSKDVVTACGRIDQPSFGALCQALETSGQVSSNWEDPGHEIARAQKAISALDEGGSESEAISEVLTVFALLHARDSTGAKPYGALPISTEALADNPIHLGSFRDRCLQWREWPISAVFEDVIAWVMNTHIRVALRKLHQAGQSTFRFRPTERGLRIVDEVPPPAPTTPRFRQAVQILRDIGALERDVSLSQRPTTPSMRGLQLMEEALD